MNRNIVASFLIVLGLLVVSVGIGAYSWPAGVIAAGVSLAVLGYLVDGPAGRRP
jgi:hypothetical protein